MTRARSRSDTRPTALRILAPLAVVSAIVACSSTDAQPGGAAGDDAGTSDDSSAPPGDAGADRVVDASFGACHPVPAGTCNDCLKSACCGSIAACLSSATCAGCMKDPSGASCTTDPQFGRVRACAGASCAAACPAIAPPPLPACATGQVCCPNGATCAPGVQYVAALCSTSFDGAQDVECCDTCPRSASANCPAVIKSGGCCAVSGSKCGAGLASACCEGTFCQVPSGATQGTCATCLDVGASCGAGTTCCAGLTCNGGKCKAMDGGPCNADADCIAGEFCLELRCHARQPAGFPCTDPSQCTTYLCSSGYCATPCNEASCGGTNCFEDFCTNSYCNGAKCCTTDDWSSEPTCE